MPRDLRDDVRCCAESIDSQSPRIASFHERAVSDESGTQKWRSLSVGVAVGNAKAKTRIGHGVFRVTAVECVAGEARFVAQVFALRPAEVTFPARPAQPRNADAFADLEIGGAFSQRG